LVPKAFGITQRVSARLPARQAYRFHESLNLGNNACFLETHLINRQIILLVIDFTQIVLAMLNILDVFFLCLHILIISFNLFAWIWIKTRRIHLIVLAGTLFSWLILGLKYGLGYCFIIDWHWEVKRKLGESNLPDSFIKYFFDHYTFLNLSAETVDLITVTSIVLVILIVVYLIFKRKVNT